MIKHILRKQPDLTTLIQLGTLIQSHQNTSMNLIHVCAQMGYAELLDLVLPYVKTKDPILDFVVLRHTK